MAESVWGEHGSGRVEKALTKVASETIHVVTAGRTDTGVHATGQVAHFDSFAVRSPLNWLRGANTHLPTGLALIGSKRSIPSFMRVSPHWRDVIGTSCFAGMFDRPFYREKLPGPTKNLMFRACSMQRRPWWVGMIFPLSGQVVASQSNRCARFMSCR